MYLIYNNYLHINTLTCGIYVFLYKLFFYWTLTNKNMINLVVWIWQFQEPETNKYRESRHQKYKYNILSFLALSKIKFPCGQVHILSFLHLDYTSSFNQYRKYNTFYILRGDFKNLEKNSPNLSSLYCPLTAIFISG